MVQEQEGGDEEQGDAVVLARSMAFSEENDSKPLTESLNFSELDTDSALQVFDRRILQ